MARSYKCHPSRTIFQIPSAQKGNCLASRKRPKTKYNVLVNISAFCEIGAVKAGMVRFATMKRAEIARRVRATLASVRGLGWAEGNALKRKPALWRRALPVP